MSKPLQTKGTLLRILRKGEGFDVLLRSIFNVLIAFAYRLHPSSDTDRKQRRFGDGFARGVYYYPRYSKYGSNKNSAPKTSQGGGNASQAQILSPGASSPTRFAGYLRLHRHLSDAHGSRAHNWVIVPSDRPDPRSTQSAKSTPAFQSMQAAS